MKAAKDILIIDDEAVVVQALGRICEEEGWTADGAEGGLEGVRLMQRGNYRLVVCDIMMEDLDGFHFLAEAQRQGWRAPVIMTTGYSTMENAVRSLGCGALDFLAKPFTVDEALAVLHRGMKCSELRRAAGNPPPACPEGYYRLGEMSWADVEPSGTVRVGVQPGYLRTIEGVAAVELQSAGTELAQGISCAALVSSRRLSHAIMCPISGRVLEANPRLAADPGLLDREPCAGGWMYRALPLDLDYGLHGLARGPGSRGEPPSNQSEMGESP